MIFGRILGRVFGRVFGWSDSEQVEEAPPLKRYAYAKFAASRQASAQPGGLQVSAKGAEGLLVDACTGSRAASASLAASRPASTSVAARLALASYAGRTVTTGTTGRHAVASVEQMSTDAVIQGAKITTKMQNDRNASAEI